MRLRRIVDRAAIAIAALALGASVCAQSTYPSKPIRMVGGFPPGGGMDLSAPDIRERLKGIGMDPGGMAPEQLAAMIRADIAKYRAIVKAAGIKAEWRRTPGRAIPPPGPARPHALSLRPVARGATRPFHDPEPGIYSRQSEPPFTTCY